MVEKGDLDNAFYRMLEPDMLYLYHGINEREELPMVKGTFLPDRGWRELNSGISEFQPDFIRLNSLLTTSDIRSASVQGTR